MSAARDEPFTRIEVAPVIIFGKVHQRDPRLQFGGAILDVCEQAIGNLRGGIAARPEASIAVSIGLAQW